MAEKSAARTRWRWCGTWRCTGCTRRSRSVWPRPTRSAAGRGRPACRCPRPAQDLRVSGWRLPATPVNDIQDALRRMAAGSYGTCERCGQPITTERLQAAPTTRWCPTCQADRCG